MLSFDGRAAGGLRLRYCVRSLPRDARLSDNPVHSATSTPRHTRRRSPSLSHTLIRAEAPAHPEPGCKSRHRSACSVFSPHANKARAAASIITQNCGSAAPKSTIGRACEGRDSIQPRHPRQGTVTPLVSITSRFCTSSSNSSATIVPVQTAHLGAFRVNHSYDPPET